MCTSMYKVHVWAAVSPRAGAQACSQGVHRGARPQAYEEKLAAENKEFAAFKKKYDISRETITRTDYEVDFITYFTSLATLGAKFNPDAYLHTVKVTKLQ